MGLRDYWTQSTSIKPEQVKLASTIDNPMIVLHGLGPEGKQCKDCTHLVGICYAKTVYKCEKRADLTHGAKTDQKRRWDACGLFEQRDEDIKLYDGR